MRGAVRLVLGAALLLTTPLQAAPAKTAPSPAFAADFRQLQAADARLNAIGFRLARANAAFCRDVQPSTGMLLTDAATYGQPAAVRHLLGIQGDIAVAAVAPESPAERAGIRPGDEVVGLALAMPQSSQSVMQRLNLLQGLYDAMARDVGQVRVELRSGTVIAGTVPACRARFELTTDGKGARAGKLIVQVSRALLDEAQGDDEAAFVVAHELAHIVLGHSRPGRTAAQLRADERTADELAPWLMANAGYDPDAGFTLLRRWGARGLRMLGDGSHDAPAARQRRVAAQIALIFADTVGAEGKHDWRPLFVPARPEP